MVKLFPHYLGWSLPANQRSWWTRSRPLDLPPRSQIAKHFFIRALQEPGGLQPKTIKRLKLQKGCTNRTRKVNGLSNKMLYAHKSYYKSTLAHQIACMGVNDPQLTGLSQAGRLCHCQAKWSIVTQVHWVLNMVRGYLIDFVCVCVRATPKVSSELFLLLLEKNQSDP